MAKNREGADSYSNQCQKYKIKFTQNPAVILDNFARINQAIILNNGDQNIFNNSKVCVLIPTYNNGGTLAKVIGDVLRFTTHIIVVNDGSTDNTSEILANYPQLKVISYKKNKGKGYAMKKGFELAKEKGYDYAITIDSDGQHSAEDLPAFAEKLKEEPEAIIIGSRNMEKEGVPGKSSFGMKFSNFWFWVETGIKHPDTQSGFRLYPLKFIEPKKFLTRKFEFEIEVIVKLSWKGVKVISVPVDVHYQKKEERVSHFRPFIDFTRISILNTFLVLWAFLWIKPRNITRQILSKPLKQHFREQISDPKFSNMNLALSIAFGVFMGIVPIWGYQMLSAIFLAYVLKLNKVLVLISANISFPPLIPLILYFSLKMGEFILGNDLNLSFHSDISFDVIKSALWSYIVGSIVLSLIAGMISGLISFTILALTRKVANPNKQNNI